MLKATELKNKEVINLTNSEKLGYINDFEICITNGEISALIVPRKSGGFVMGKNKGLRIPWGNISAIGEDVILVNVVPDE